MQCEDCGHTWTGPGYDQEINNSHCPNCGGFRTQAIPAQSEMALRDMPMNGQDDMGGNPLQEGIWGNTDGGWKNRMKRDESFASVRNAQDNPYNPITDDDKLRYFRQMMQEDAPRDPQGGGWSLWNKDPRDITPEEALVMKQEDPRRFQQEFSGHDRIHQMEGFDIGHEAPHSEEWMGNGAGDTGYQWQQGQHARGLIDHGGQIHMWPQETGQLHEQYARENKIQWPPPATFDVEPDGRINPLLGEISPEHAQQLQAKGLQHGGPSVYDEGDWGDDDDWGEEPVQKAASNRDKLYLPWGRETSSVEQDFEVVQVIPNGPHTEEVDVSGEDNPVILQHDNPKVLDDIKQRVEAAQKTAFLPILMGALASGVAGEMGAGMIGRSLVGGLVRGALSGNKGQAAGGSAIQSPAMQAPEMPQEYLSSIHQQLRGAFDGPFDNHPSSDQGLVERASGDPDDVDAHEVNDGDHSEFQNDPTVNDQGGTDQFAPEVQEALKEAEPVLLHYFNSDESGADDPRLQKLVQLLEQADPGLLDAEPTPEDHELLKSLKTSAQGVGQVGVPGIGGVTPAPAVGPAPPSVAPHTQSNCPHCGALVQPGSPICAQCNGAIAQAPNTAIPTDQATAYPAGQQPFPGQPGMPQGVYGSHTASQGPQSREQIMAVAEIVGMDKLQDIILNPDQYADVLAQVAGRDDPPTPDPSPAAPPPMPDPSQMGMMPPGGVPPGGGMPMQAATDSVAGKCPKCGSHTTGIVSDDGDMECSNCGNGWKPNNVQKQVEMPATASRQSFDHAELHPHVDALGVPAADQMTPDDPAKDQNPGSWTTAGGEPLRVGQMYEMHTAQYDIPDIVKIESIKPDEIEYTLTGEYNLAHRTSVTKEEADMDGISFNPVGQDADDNLNEQQPPDQMQAPTMAPALSHTAGKKYTPMQQREFIDEPGVARNADKLDLKGTHYEANEQASMLGDDYFLFM